MRLEPFQKASTEMGGGFQFGKFLQDFKIWLVALSEQFFEDMIEVA
jgi:hypothetical protein